MVDSFDNQWRDRIDTSARSELLVVIRTAATLIQVCKIHEQCSNTSNRSSIQYTNFDFF